MNHANFHYSKYLYLFHVISFMFLKPDFHLKIISREILHSSNLIGFAQFSAKKVENISTFFNFARKRTIENGPIFEFRIHFFKWKSGLIILFPQIIIFEYIARLT